MAGDCHAAWPGFRLRPLLRRIPAVRCARAAAVLVGFGLIANYPYSAPYEDVTLVEK